jgi:glycosyltransferase involved in cell wall biosynthesis
MGSGPQWGKPIADLALLSTWRRRARIERRAGRPFDFVLAHNAEAAWVALATRAETRVPVVYVAHTILGYELSAYLPERLGTGARGLGIRIDSLLARRADGIIALCEEARRKLEPQAREPVAMLPPGGDPGPGPSAASIAESCRKYALIPGAYTLYSGNRDRYQELDLLRLAASRLPESAPPIVVASHAGESGKPGAAAEASGLCFVHVENFEEMQQLIYGAHCLVMARRRRGGFPIKLLNYMAAARPIVAFEGVAVALENERSGLLLEAGAGGAGIAGALARLNDDPDLASRLGAEARRILETEYAWKEIAARTCDYLGSLRVARPDAGSPAL